MNNHYNEYLPIAIQLMVTLGFISVTLLMSWLLGPKIKTKNKLDAFESGLAPVGNARVQFSIKYFLVATLFVLFDVEVIFFYPWAVNFKHFSEQGANEYIGFIKMLIFMSSFLIGFFYIIKKKALDWE
ncbi:MAG: NADH-quinone oxidoreductase subunit A [Cytophagales bacterium]|nr:NADH-quinone oxidoreductase subunit A [Cytophaga sp.]